MNTRPLESFMSVGIVHFMAFPDCLNGTGPIVETLAHIADDPFFTAVEVGPIDDAAERRDAAALLKIAGLDVGFGCQPILLAGGHDLNSSDPGTRREALDACLRGLDQAVELGAQQLAVLSGRDPGEPRRKVAVDHLVVSLTELGERCTEAGLRLCLETFDRDVDKRCLIGPNALAVEVSRRVRERVPTFGLMVDLSHLPLQGESIRDAIAATSDHLVHVHIGNCVLNPADPLYGDQHPRFGYPGGANGVSELRAFLETLLEVGYLQADRRAPVAFEVKPIPGESASTTIASSQRTLVRAWSTISGPGVG